MAAPILGDLLFRAVSLWTRLAGNTTTTRKFLSQTGTGAASAAPVWNQVTDADLSTSNITTNNVSITKHGFTPILPNDATKYLDGTGAYTVPPGAGSGTVTTSGAPASGNLAKFSGATAITNADLTGDVTTSGTVAATIAANAVTNAKAAQMAAHTFKGNNTGSTADPLDLTVTQATAELNAFVGDSGSGGTKGLVPAPAAGDTAAKKFLGAAAAWATVKDSDLSVTNVTTNDATTSAHGFAPKGTVGTTQFWRQDWTLATPAGAGNVTTSATLTSGKTIQGNGSADVTVSSLTATVTKYASGTPSAATDGTDYLSPTTGLTQIAQQTPTGTAVTFSSLGSFTHLRIMWSARGDQSATSTNMNLTFNGDGGSNYDRENLSAGGTSATAAESLAATSAAIGSVAAATATAGMAGVGYLEIFDYRGTTFQKGGISFDGLRRATTTGNQFAREFAIGWRDTSAITSITITLASGNFVTGSKFTLYGLP